MKKFDKYPYYENSVQTPEDHVTIFDRVFREIRGRDAISLKEDFCGTFLISCEWVKSDPKRVSYGIDLDPEPLAYGRAHAYKRLKASEKKRVKIFKQNVNTPLQKKVDVIGAGNFSFFIFKEREALLQYFKAALKSMNREGVLVLEMAGGPGFIQPGREQRTYTLKGFGKYTYYWDQKSFDPITHYGTYAIHFRDPRGKFHKDVFTYDWRVWSLPELKQMMLDAGFKDTAVYWEGTGKDGEGTGEYLKTESGDNSFSWIAFMVGIK